MKSIIVALFVACFLVVATHAQNYAFRGGPRADNGYGERRHYALGDRVRGGIRGFEGIPTLHRGLSEEIDLDKVFKYLDKAEKIYRIIKDKQSALSDEIDLDKIFKYLDKAGKIYQIIKNRDIAEEQELSDSASGHRISNAEALNRIRSAGIGISSSGGCHEKNNRRCTSLDQVFSGTIDMIITLKRASGCPITITGGTEIGHAGGTYSHANGYKLDISLNSCINGYITRSFAYQGKRGDGADLYKASSGSLYAKEGNHWDITYF